ncbi:MAG: choice-of-anchor X domain-containing protein [Acidobacteriota bacterium]
MFRKPIAYASSLAFLVLLNPGIARAAIIQTELAGNPLGQYPFFEYVRAFNVDEPLRVAIDPTRFPAIAGETCDVYVVNHKTPSEWAATPALSDVTTGGAMSRAFVAGTIQANTFQVAASSELNANAGLGLGVGYDVVLDCDRDGALTDGDFIDGLGGEAGLYVVHDTTARGPAAVTESVYSITTAVAATFGVPDWERGQNVYYPTAIGSMGKRPLVVVGHGAGHNFQWYDHIGNHLASYGYVVVSIDNDISTSANAAFTTIGHTGAFIDQAQAGNIAGGALVDHIDASRIVWIGHSRGGEGVAIAYDRLFDGTSTSTRFSRQDIRLVSSMLPTDFNSTNVANPHDANFHLWTASGDSDVNGSAGNRCPFGDTQRCQTFHLHDRATAYRQSTVVQGTGHGWFHDQESAGAAFTGPCPLTEAITHEIQLGYLLPLVKHYVDDNIPALDFLTRQYESFHPIGVDTSNACLVVSNEYRNGSSAGNFVIDDYQTQTSTTVSSSGASVSFNVQNLTEGRLDDNNSTFAWPTDGSDPFNGATQGNATDSTRGVVFDWTSSDRFYEWRVPAAASDFTQFRYLSFRGAQGTRHPNTLDSLGDLTFSVTLRDTATTPVTSTINIGAYGGGLEQPYQRESGWHNEMETIRIRTSDFLNNGSGLNLSSIAAVRLDVGPSFGSPRGRVVIDDLMLTNDLSPLALRILEPTTSVKRFAGTSVAGSRVLVRLVAGGGLDLSPGNLTISVDGTALTPAQIPTPAVQVGGETWVVISPGPKADGCYDLTVALTTPSGVSATEAESLCWEDDEAREFDRVLAIDQTNSMHYDGGTGVFSTAKMDAARAAAKFFVNLSNPNDKIGVISFQRRDQDGDGTVVDPDELAEPKFAFVTAGEGATDQRPAARTAIDGISPDTSPGFSGAETSIGAGLVEARTMLDAGAVAGHEPHIVLLTDGLENYAPYWTRTGPGGPLRPVFDADDIRVDTVGIGADADDELLTDVASVTGGEFRNLNEGAGSFFLLSRLSDWYKSVDEDVRGEQRFYYAEGFPKPSTSATHRGQLRAFFRVEPGLDWMTVAFHANVDHAATVLLFEPGATVAVTAAPPAITLRADPKHSVYRIRQPKPGVWSYLVDPQVNSAEFFAVASAPTALSARVGPNQLTETSDGNYSMPLRVWIADTTGVLGANVGGYVRRPDGVKTPITLRDNGSSMDGKASDGIYGLEYLATIPGAYYVRLRAVGTSSAGDPFERYLSAAFVVPGQPKRPRPPGEGGPRPPTGEGCDCEGKAKYSLALFTGRTFPHGGFDTVADPSFSLGIKPALNFNAGGRRASLGLYLGYDEFSNPNPGGNFELTHLSPELELALWPRICPIPTLHVGVGAYRDETGSTELGFNAGLGLSVCLNQRYSFVARYDYRSVNAFERDYSTVQLGLRLSF